MHKWGSNLANDIMFKEGAKWCRNWFNQMITFVKMCVDQCKIGAKTGPRPYFLLSRHSCDVGAASLAAPGYVAREKIQRIQQLRLKRAASDSAQVLRQATSQRAANAKDINAFQLGIDRVRNSQATTSH